MQAISQPPGARQHSPSGERRVWTDGPCARPRRRRIRAALALKFRPDGAGAAGAIRPARCNGEGRPPEGADVSPSQARPRRNAHRLEGFRGASRGSRSAGRRVDRIRGAQEYSDAARRHSNRPRQLLGCRSVRADVERLSHGRFLSAAGGSLAQAPEPSGRLALPRDRQGDLRGEHHGPSIPPRRQAARKRRQPHVSYLATVARPAARDLAALRRGDRAHRRSADRREPVVGRS